MTSAQPIGILDSGFGGLSVAKAVRQALPHEDIIYACDCGFAPWGDRTDDFINERVDAVVGFLIQSGVKAIVIACNTATAVSAVRLRARYAFPIVGIEPALLPAARVTRSRTVGVLATTKTLKSSKYRHLRERIPADITVLDRPCPGLMDCVEAGAFRTPLTIELVNRLVKPLTAAGADTLVLGCTHYPFLSPVIAEAAGPGVTLIDPAPAVARELKRRLEEARLLTSSEKPGTETFHTTGKTKAREDVLRTLWHQDAQLLAL